MKTQISRNSHRPEQRYDGVFQQQGRMLTDADWNELVQILNQRLDRALGDAIGSGVPRVGGLGVSFDGGDLRIQPGRIYVDGRAAWLEPVGDGEAYSFDAQPDLPALTQLGPSATGWIYADVWTRAISAHEDPVLADPALHGADTCTRTRTMVQIKFWPDREEGPRPEDVQPRKGAALLSVRRRAHTIARDECGGRIDVDAPTGNLLLRVEVHDVGPHADGGIPVTLKWSLENGAEVHPYEPGPTLPDRFRAPAPTCYEVFTSDHEKQAGVHHRPVDRPPLVGEGALDRPNGTPRAAGHFVRRWDGQGRWTVSTDRAPIAVDAGPVAIEIDASDALRGGRPPFVIGDYWLVPIREAGAVDADGHIVTNRPPDGIEHRYLTLARLDRGALRTEVNAIPRLTTLDAGDVSFTPPPCAGGLYASWDEQPRTVKDALDAICTLDAGQVRAEGAGSGDVQGALDALSEQIRALEAKLADVRAQDDCGARLALFGSGVLDGLIPTVEMEGVGRANRKIAIRTSRGRIIDQQGCVREVPVLNQTVPLDASAPSKPSPLSEEHSDVYRPGIESPTATASPGARATIEPPATPAVNWPSLLLDPRPQQPGDDLLAALREQPTAKTSDADAPKAAPEVLADGQAQAQDTDDAKLKQKRHLETSTEPKLTRWFDVDPDEPQQPVKPKDPPTSESSSNAVSEPSGERSRPFKRWAAPLPGASPAVAQPEVASTASQVHLDDGLTIDPGTTAFETQPRVSRRLEARALWLVETEGGFALALDDEPASDEASVEEGVASVDPKLDLGLPFQHLVKIVQSDSESPHTLAINERYDEAVQAKHPSLPQSVTPAGAGRFKAAEEHRRQWSPYAALMTARPDPSTRIRLGTVLQAVDGAWVIPDGREAIVATPARVVAANQRRRPSYLGRMRELLSGEEA